MPRSRTALVFLGIILCQAAGLRQIRAQANPASYTGKYKAGLKPSPAELANILKKHAEWINYGDTTNSKLSSDSRRANLCNAEPIRVNLRGANLAGADLDGASLNGAQLDGAKLMAAHLDGDLNGAHLTNAELDDAHLPNAGLSGAYLRHTPGGRGPDKRGLRF
jgi:uncharacterized protein YjbI with pentapeptide repeats